MSVVKENIIKCKLCDVIRFLWAKNHSAAEIYRKLGIVYEPNITDWWNLKLGWKASEEIYYKCAESPVWVAKNFSICRAYNRTYSYTMYSIIKFLYLHWYIFLFKNGGYFLGNHRM